jgi:chromosome segregation ATPase
MLSEKQLDILRSENELLQIQLDDVNQMIQIREEELELLRNRAREAAAMQSQLDQNLHEFEQMQLHLGKCQQKNSGQSERLEALENELYQSIKEQLGAAETLKHFKSMEANLNDTSNELQEIAAVYHQLVSIKKTAAAAQSELEIAYMEINSLKEELAEAKALSEMLLQNKLQ